MPRVNMNEHECHQCLSFILDRRPRIWICVAALLVVLTLGPALARSNGGSWTLQCMNNHRQLCAAWRMYAEDNRDFNVYSSDDGFGTSP